MISRNKHRVSCTLLSPTGGCLLKAVTVAIASAKILLINKLICKDGKSYSSPFSFTPYKFPRGVAFSKRQHKSPLKGMST